MEPLQRYWKRNKELSWQNFGDGMIVLDSFKGKVHELNDSAAWMWENVHGLSGNELVEKVLVEYDVDRSQAEVDVTRFLEEACRLGIIN